MKLIKWKRPSGKEIETNDLKDTIALAESLGWKRTRKAKAKVSASDGNSERCDQERTTRDSSPSE